MLHFQQLPQPGEVLLIRIHPNTSFFVFPVRSNTLLCHSVHRFGTDLYFKRHSPMADNLCMKGLISVRSGHRDQVLETTRHRLPGLMNNAQRRVAVAHRGRNHSEGNQVVDLLQRHSLSPNLFVNRVESLDPRLDPLKGSPSFRKRLVKRSREIVNRALRRLPASFHPCPHHFVRFGFEMLESEIFEFILDLLHPEPMGNRGVDVQGLLRNLRPTRFGQVVQRAHVVNAIGKLDQDHPNVVDHRQQHLAEILGLAFLGRGKRNHADLCNPLDHMCHFWPEQLQHPIDGGEGVLDDVMKQASRDRDIVQSHVSHQRGHLKRMGHVGLTRLTFLPRMRGHGEIVGLTQQGRIGIRIEGTNLIGKRVEAEHRIPLPIA